MATFEKVRLATEALRHAVPDFHKWFEGALPDGKEGLRLLEGGNYAEAEKCFQRVVAAFKDRPLPGGRYARVLLALATTQWKQKRLGEARETAESARELLTGPTVKRGPDLAECLDLLGRIYSGEGDPAAAQSAFQEALDIEKEARQPDCKILTERYRRLAAALWEEGRLDEARDAFEQAVKTSEKAHGEMHVLTADCLVDLGQCLSARDEHGRAREAIEKGLAIHKELCGPDSEEVARDYQALASAAHTAKDLEASVTYYEKALHLRERQLGGSAAEFAMLLVNLAAVHSTEGRSARALELLQQAVPRLEGARDERVALALNDLGVVYLQNGRYQDAMSSLRKARGHWEKAPEKNREFLEANSQLLEEMGNYLSVEQAERLIGSSAPAAPRREWDTPEGEEPPAFSGGPLPGLPGETPPNPVFPWLEEETQALPEPMFTPGEFVETNPAEPIAAHPYPLAAFQPIYAHPPGPAQHPRAFQRGTIPAGAPPQVYYPYYPPGPAQQERGDQNVQLTFVRPDGTPLDRAAHSPTLHLTVLVPDGAMPQKAAAVVKQAPASGQESRALGGWEDLAFDFLSTA